VCKHEKQTPVNECDTSYCEWLCVVHEWFLPTYLGNRTHTRTLGDRRSDKGFRQGGEEATLAVKGRSVQENSAAVE